jgi:hypothetical protein
VSILPEVFLEFNFLEAIKSRNKNLVEAGFNSAVFAEFAEKSLDELL